MIGRTIGNETGEHGAQCDCHSSQGLDRDCLPRHISRTREKRTWKRFAEAEADQYGYDEADDWYEDARHYGGQGIWDNPWADKDGNEVAPGLPRSTGEWISKRRSDVEEV